MEEIDKKENGEYTGEIKGGLRPSMKLVVMGIINKKPKSMEVIVYSEPQEEEPEGDVGLQLKVSFMDKAVHRNARMAGKWGRPETTLSFFPFAPGESFKMEIVCEHQQFRILVDGQPLCGFSHRIPGSPPSLPYESVETYSSPRWPSTSASPKQEQHEDVWGQYTIHTVRIELLFE